MKRIDYWVVGAGSAGCIVARVLSEAGYHVGIIEAGQATPPRRRPAEYLSDFGTDQDWQFKTTPQPALARRQLIQPRGRGPGGSTRINAMIWYPPRAVDWQVLEQHTGPHFDRQRGLASLDTVTAWVDPQPPRWVSMATDRYLRTNLLAIEPPHVFRRMANREGRVTAADLLPAAAKAGDAHPAGGSITIVHAIATRVLFRGDHACGVQVRYPGAGVTTDLVADQGVILCGGALASPAILIASGIGPAADVTALGIDSRSDLPDVGNHLCDHLIMPIVFATADPHRFPPRPSVADLARWEIARVGPLASNLAESGGIYRLLQPSGAATDSPCISDGSDEFQVHVTPTHYLTHPSDAAVAALTLGVNLCQPRSTGRVEVLAIDPESRSLAGSPCGPAMRIDPGYLSDRHDLVRMIAAVQQGRQIADDPALRSFVGRELVPGADRHSEPSLARAIARFSQTLYHPVGTCRLGLDPHSVVDPTGAVRNTENLYVIDGSILPKIPSVNPNATIMMLAHCLASQRIR